MVWSCVLQVMRGGPSITLDVARRVEHDFGISMSAQIVRCAPQRSGLSSQHKKKNHIFLTKMSKHFLTLLEFTTIFDKVI